MVNRGENITDSLGTSCLGTVSNGSFRVGAVTRQWQMEGVDMRGFAGEV